MITLAVWAVGNCSCIVIMCASLHQVPFPDHVLPSQVRKAFKAEEGNTLVVADYGQLELRLLAHMAGCASMLEAFRLGGDFHSRTALGMYDHIKAAIDRGTLPHFSPYIWSLACSHFWVAIQRDAGSPTLHSG